MEYFANSSLVIWYKFVLHRFEALKYREILQIFPQKLGPVYVGKGCQRPELMRIPRAVLIVEFVVDGVAVGWDLL
jgi:hypothetical protein